MKSFIKYFLAIFFALFCEDALCNHQSRSHHARSQDGKIVGGYNTTIENIPYQVYLLLQKGNDYYQCGGSIISKRHVLTAAHCLTGIQRIFVRAGSTDSSSGGSQYTTSAYVQHPRYNPKTSDYDIGIITLAQDMNLDGKTTKAIQLPEANANVPAGTNVLVSGWGATSENGDTSRTLMAVTVPTVSNPDCQKSYGSSITKRMFCAGVPQGGKDSCQGDSGGPAVNAAKQLGVVSFGVGCARAGYPGVYTNVAALRSWIKANSGV